MVKEKGVVFEEVISDSRFQCQVTERSGAQYWRHRKPKDEGSGMGTNLICSESRKNAMALERWTRGLGRGVSGDREVP